MPNYSFTVLDGNPQPDHMVVEIMDDDAAHREAVTLMGAVLQQEPELLKAGRELSVEVRKNGSKILFSIVAVSTLIAVTEGNGLASVLC